MRSFDYDVKEKLNKWKAKAEMRKIRPLLIAEQNFSPAENSSSNKGVLSKNQLKDTAWKWRLRKKAKHGRGGQHYKSSRPGSSLSVEEKYQDEKLHHDHKDSIGKREEAVKRQVLPTAQKDKRSQASRVGRCCRGDDFGTEKKRPETRHRAQKQNLGKAYIWVLKYFRGLWAVRALALCSSKLE